MPGPSDGFYTGSRYAVLGDQWSMHRCPEHAIEAWADAIVGAPSPGAMLDVSAMVADRCPVVVVSYKHGAVLLAQTSWGCEEIDRRTYAADDVIAYLQEVRPEWFVEREG